MEHVLLAADLGIVTKKVQKPVTVSPPNELSNSGHEIESSSDTQHDADKKIGNVSLLIKDIITDLTDQQIRDTLKQHLDEKTYLEFDTKANEAIGKLQDCNINNDPCNRAKNLEDIIQNISSIRHLINPYFEINPFDAHEKRLLVLQNNVEEHTHTDPFFLAYNNLSEETKTIPEIIELFVLDDNDSYTWTMEEESLKSKRERSEGLRARLWIITSTGSEPAIKAKYPFSFFSQLLRAELNQVVDSNLLDLREQLYLAINKIHLQSQGTRNERSKLIDFEQAVLDYYYKIRKAETSEKSLGNAIEEFINNNIVNKYLIQVPHSVKENDQPTNIASLIKRYYSHPVRIAELDIEQLDISEIEKQVTRLKYEYDEIILTSNNKYSSYSVLIPDLKEAQKRKQIIKILENNNIHVHDSVYAKDIIQVSYPNNDVLFLQEPNKTQSTPGEQVSAVLKKYIRVRLQQQIESGSEFNNLFGWSWFSIMSSSLKRSASVKLIAFIEYERKLSENPYNLQLILNPPKLFTEDQISALTEGTLGERLKHYGYDANKISELQKAIHKYKNNAKETQKLIDSPRLKKLEMDSVTIRSIPEMNKNDYSLAGKEVPPLVNFDSRTSSVEDFVANQMNNKNYETSAREVHNKWAKYQDQPSVPEFEEEIYELKGKEVPDKQEKQKTPKDYSTFIFDKKYPAFFTEKSKRKFLKDWEMIDNSYKKNQSITNRKHRR